MLLYISFVQDVINLKTVFEDLGSPFEETSSDLISLETKDVVSEKGVENL